MATGGKFSRFQFDASDALYDFPCNPCAKDGKNMEAIFQCMDCQVFYCSTCVTGHNKFTENHNVVEKTSKLFGQRQLWSFSSNELPADLCEEHRGEVIKMFCRQHDLVCCSVCVAVNHRSCEGVEYIPDIAKGLLKKRDKDKTKASLEKVKDDLYDLKSKLSDKLKELNDQRDDILDEIQMFKKRLLAKIEELESKSIREVQNKHQEFADEITSSSKQLDDVLKDVEQQLDRLKNGESNNETQLFVDIKVGEQISSVGSYYARQSAGKKMDNLFFERNTSIENCLFVVQALGKLTLRPAVVPYACSTVLQRRFCEKAITAYSYEAENDDELSLKVGDIIKIIDKVLQDEGWWKGELNGKIGVFPNNFVELM